MFDQIPDSPLGESVAVPEPHQARLHPQFNGRAGEYFGIWIVNLLLSIVTLGIYSAWAKVRTERYFYGNTVIAGSAFEYLAQPIAILKGRLIAYAAVITLALSSKFMPMLYLGLMFVLFLCVPLLIFLSLRFRARYSAWRGLRFRFDDTASAAYGPFMLWSILAGLSLSLLYPVMKKRQHAYVVDGHWFGRKRFKFSGDTEEYYKPYGVAVGLYILMFVGMMMFIGAMMKGGAVAKSGGGASAGLSMGFLIFMVFFYLSFFSVAIYLRTRYTNLMWNSSQLGSHRFESSLRARDMMWLYASNAVAVLCTLGLATPWAMVRLAHYRAQRLAVLTNGSLEDFVADMEDGRAAVGAEFVDAFDLGMDVGL